MSDANKQFADALKQAFGAASDNMTVAAEQVAELVASNKSIDLNIVSKSINEGLSNSDANTREAAARIVTAIVNKKDTRIEAYTVNWLPNLLDAYADKKINVRGPAAEAAKALIQYLNENALSF
ncbi:unnamed protein product, partial [Aphanomyces euteiches]